MAPAGLVYLLFGFFARCGGSSADFGEELSFFQFSNTEPGLPAEKARRKEIRRVGKSTARGKASGFFFSGPQGNGRIKRCCVLNRPAANSFSNKFLKKSKFLLQIEGNADILPCGLMLFFYTLFNGSGRRLITLVLFNLGLCVWPKADMSLISAFFLRPACLPPFRLSVFHIPSDKPPSEYAAAAHRSGLPGSLR